AAIRVSYFICPVPIGIVFHTVAALHGLKIAIPIVGDRFSDTYTAAGKAVILSHDQVANIIVLIMVAITGGGICPLEVIVGGRYLTIIVPVSIRTLRKIGDFFAQEIVSDLGKPSRRIVLVCPLDTPGAIFVPRLAFHTAAGIIGVSSIAIRLIWRCANTGELPQAVIVVGDLSGLPVLCGVWVGYLHEIPQVIIVVTSSVDLIIVGTDLDGCTDDSATNVVDRGFLHGSLIVLTILRQRPGEAANGRSRGSISIIEKAFFPRCALWPGWIVCFCLEVFWIPWIRDQPIFSGTTDGVIFLVPEICGLCSCSI